VDLLTLPEKLKCPKLLKKFPAFYGTRRFITIFTRARHLSLSWPRLIQSMPHPPSNLSKIYFNIILPSMPGSYKWSLSLRFTHYSPVLKSLELLHSYLHRSGLQCLSWCQGHLCSVSFLLFIVLYIPLQFLLLVTHSVHSYIILTYFFCHTHKYVIKPTHNWAVQKNTKTADIHL
jgi:hypothetical protein